MLCCLTRSVEHLPHAEGLDGVAVESSPESRWKSRTRGFASCVHQSWGPVLGATARSDGRPHLRPTRQERALGRTRLPDCRPSPGTADLSSTSSARWPCGRDRRRRATGRVDLLCLVSWGQSRARGDSGWPARQSRAGRQLSAATRGPRGVASGRGDGGFKLSRAHGDSCCGIGVG
jgi:hypothetical protein